MKIMKEMLRVFTTLVTFKLYLGIHAHGSDGNGGCKLNPTYTLCLKLMLSSNFWND